MKNNLILFFLLILITDNICAAITLKESFEAARLNMESIKRADATIEISQEQKTRARAAILPTVNGIGTYTRIDPPDAAGASPFLLTRQYSAGIRLIQPLIRGGTVSAYQLAKDNILLAKYQKDATEINLYQLVINSYYNLNIAQMDVKNVQEFLKFSNERVKEIRERTLIGRSRKGELVEAQGQFHNAESQYQQSLIRQQEAEASFEFYTRMKPDEVVVPSEIPKVTGSLEEYLMKVRSRPDILAVRQQVKVAEQQVSISKGGHYPQVDLISNYYFDRTGILASSEWDVGVAVVIPLFQGGSVMAATREAIDARRIAELTGSETERAAERDLSINYRNLERLQEQLKSVKTALEKTEEAYRLNKKDYQYGLVTNLDVLLSLNAFIEAKRTYYSLIAIAHLNLKNLEASTGVLP